MLYSTIKEEMIAAQKAADTKLLGVLKLIFSELSYAQVDFKGGELPDEEVLRVLSKEAKKRKESIEIYEKAGDVDRSGQEKYELSVIEKYLPKMMEEAEVEKVIAETASETGLNGGRLMGAVMGKLRGKADGTIVQKIVNQKFAA